MRWNKIVQHCPISSLFLRAVEFWPTFDIQIDMTFTIFWDKLQNHTFWKAHNSVSKHVKIHISRATHCEITAFKKMKNLSFFDGSFFKIKIADILNFEWIEYLGEYLSYSKIWGIEISIIVEITGRQSCYFISLNVF